MNKLARKTILVIALTMALIISAAGVLIMMKNRRRPADTPVEPEAVEKLIVVDSADDFRDIGVNIGEPQKAEKAEYYIIDGKIAQIDFVIDGINYTLRAAMGIDYQQLCALPGDWIKSSREGKAEYYTVKNNTESHVSVWYDTSCCFTITGGSEQQLAEITENYLNK